MKLTGIKEVRNLKTKALVSEVKIKSFNIMAKFEVERKSVNWEPKSLIKFEALPESDRGEGIKSDIIKWQKFQVIRDF